MKTNRTIGCLVMLVALVMGTSLLANADPIATLRLGTDFVDPNHFVIIADNSALDSNPLVGVVSYIGGVGTTNWVVNVTTGITWPVLSPYGHMTLNTVNITSAAGGILDLDFTVQNLDPALLPQLPQQLRMDFGGTTEPGGEVDYDAWLGPGNGAFEYGSLIGNLGFSGTSFSLTTIGVVNPTALFSLTQELMINHPTQGASQFSAELTPIPEPISLVLFGTGLLGLKGVVRRRMK